MLLTNFYKMPPPPLEALKKRDKKVAALIQQMGTLYRLHSPMPRTQ